jgi:hypothetical protein
VKGASGQGPAARARHTPDTAPSGGPSPAPSFQRFAARGWAGKQRQAAVRAGLVRGRGRGRARSCVCARARAGGASEAGRRGYLAHVGSRSGHRSGYHTAGGSPRCSHVDQQQEGGPIRPKAAQGRHQQLQGVGRPAGQAAAMPGRCQPLSRSVGSRQVRPPLTPPRGGVRFYGNLYCDSSICLQL